MKNISVTDLKLIPELKHLRMLDFIDPQYADLIAPYLAVLGIDLEYPVEFVPCQHRNLQGQVVIGFVIAGEVQCNAAFLESGFATSEDRIIAAGYKDLGLANELASVQTASRDYGNSPADGFPPDLMNDNEKEILLQIKVLEDMLLLARGTPFKSDGSRRLFHEANLVEHTPEKMSRRKRIAK